MNSTNQKIHDFLKYYCDLPHPPEYAVLIKGKWGTGKTWFIKNLISDLNTSSIRSLHISLYGMNSFDEIENEFFRQLHPVLSSKKMALAGKVLKGLVKTTFKIDLGKDEASISSSIPDLDLPDYLKDTEKFVLIFDDIERCDMPICNLLGYINYFVEHSGYKVIMLANEEEILEKDSNSLSYKRVKEKLIGKTFEIVPEVDIALAAFISQSSSVENKKILEEQKPLITSLYNASNYKNLRHLKQAIADFEWLLDAISEKATSNINVIKSLITTYLVFTFEIKSGEMQASQIKDISNEWVKYFLDKVKDKDNVIHKITLKYPEFNIYDLILSEELWMQIFDKGFFDEALIQNSVDQSKYLFTENTPPWKRLWYASELQDDEISKLLAQVDNEFENRQHSEIEVFLHIFGILLYLSETGIYAKNKEQILIEGKAYVDYLKVANLLADQAEAINRPFFHNSAHSLGYHHKDSTEFKQLDDYLIEKCKAAVIENYPAVAIELLQLMKTDAMDFSIQLYLCNHKDNRYYDIPILPFIDVDTFVSNFIGLPQRAKWNIYSMLEQRYSLADFNKKLTSEATWLESVSTNLAAEAANFPKTMQNHNLSNASAAFAKAATKLKETVL